MTDKQKYFVVKLFLNELLLPIIEDNQDRIQVLNAILEDVVTDVEETADPYNWNTEDVRIALARLIKNKLAPEF